MGKLVTSLLGGGWIYLVVAGAIAATSFVGGLKWQYLLDRDDIATANTASLQAQRDLADVNASVANNRADVATEVAKANAAAFDRERGLNAQIIALTNTLRANERNFTAQSAKLREDLLHAQPGDIRDLGPAAIKYFDSVRQSQSNGATPKAGGNQAPASR